VKVSRPERSRLGGVVKARLERVLERELDKAEAEGVLKGEERVLAGCIPAAGTRGIRWNLAGEGQREFIRMNSNSYLGLSLHPSVCAAGERASRELGAGPGAVRFISGTARTHVELEKRLASFHGREACMLFSAAYAAVMGVVAPLITPETVVVSDELNHNSIINAIRVGRPGWKVVTPHLSVAAVEGALKEHAGGAKRALVVTDGVFSMRGDCAPLDRLAEVCRKYDNLYEEGTVLVADDSHGVGACGRRGRGTEEVMGGKADILLATLGKAFGVNGGYVAAGAVTVRYLRENSPFYVYSNPVSPGEAAAALAAVEILDSPDGEELIRRLGELREQFVTGLAAMGWETLPGVHPIVPVLIRDTARTAKVASFLYRRGVLATGLNYPVVPKGEEEIRFQMNASLTDEDIRQVLRVMGEFLESEAGGGPRRKAGG
jgi:glycine C-acetyltransferase